MAVGKYSQVFGSIQNNNNNYYYYKVQESVVCIRSSIHFGFYTVTSSKQFLSIFLHESLIIVLSTIYPLIIVVVTIFNVAMNICQV